MGTECPNVYQELTNMQLKIASLFQDLLRERTDFKQKNENLNINLDRLSSKAETLKKENTALRQINNEMKSIIYQGVKVFKNLNFSNVNLRKEQVTELENLKKNFLETCRNLENHELADEGGTTKKFCLDQTDKSSEPIIKRYAIDEEEIKKEFESIKDLNLTTQFFHDDINDVTSNSKVPLNKSKSVSVLNNLFERKPQNLNEEVIRNLKHPLLVLETETFDSENINANSSKVLEAQKTESLLCKSPVFKDFGVRKQEGLPTEVSENDITNSRLSPINRPSEKIVEKSNNSIISPWKKPGYVFGSSPTKGPSTPKRARKKLKMASPKGSPKAHLKKSNSREVEISVSGVRQLTQTLLNIDFYKRESPEKWKSRENRENEDFGNISNIKEETKEIIDPEEDDFIIESPKKSENLLEDIKKANKNGNVLNDIQFITPPETSDADLDETYVSASLVKRCELTKKHVLERIIEDQTPLKRISREKSPEYDSVPFVYKREPKRKKAERMKLPGHACLECNKYYENALGDIDTQHLKQILNKCSRHRDKNSPTHDATPQGYWKPYLTCSIMVSPKKNDA